MRIAVMAAGAVGGYFGGRLAAAGHDVVFFARGAHLAALRQDGLTLKSTAGDLHLPKVNATEDAKSVAPVDAVIFAVKLWDTEAAGEQTRPLIGPNTRVITLQNGVDTLDRLRPILGDCVIGCSAQIASTISAPGVISHTSPFAILRCGREGGKADPALAAFVDTAKAAGLDITLIPDIEVELWKKFVFLVGLSGITTASRLPVGGWRTDPDTRGMFLKVMKEVVAVANAKGIALRDDFAESRLAFIDKAPSGFKASMAHDLDRGNRLELDWLAGGVVKMARELGVATPMNEAVYALLKPYRMGKPTVV
jgi:2-dehydropantoate 2-reductase